MIISHKHKFIFIHCRKVAGSSIKVALASHLHRDDLLVGSWVDCFDNGIPFNKRALRDLLHPRSAVNLCLRMVSRPTQLLDNRHVAWSVNGAIKEKYKGKLGKYPEHGSAGRLQMFCGKHWDDYYKFCFVRNPFDRVVSEYIWVTKTRKLKGLSFSDFVKALKDPYENTGIVNPNFNNWPMYTINDKLVVDRVARFENLSEDFNSIAEEIGLEINGKLPHAKNNLRRFDYRSWYSTDDKVVVKELFEKEINQFNYEF